MKHSMTILAAMSLAATALALPGHIAATAHWDTWQDSQKKDKAIKEIEKYIDAPTVIDFALFATNTSGEQYGVTIYWSPQWTKKADKLDDADKLETLNEKLQTAASVTLYPANDWRQAVADAGLMIYDPATSGGVSTTTTAATTTTTTTTAE